jgi:hypothetical protein
MLELDEGGNSQLVMQTVQGLVLELDKDFQLGAAKILGLNSSVE